MSLMSSPLSQKENRPIPSSSTRVAWRVSLNEYFDPSSSPTKSRRSSTTSHGQPKSILKSTSSFSLLPYDDAQTGFTPREETPEPAQPLQDANYLASPVSIIVAEESSIAQLITAYSIFLARLRSTVTPETDEKISWPFLTPLRKHRDALACAFERDLGRALESHDGAKEVAHKVLTASSTNSPRKKIGVSAEEATAARDFCRVCHAAIRCLGVIFAYPVVYAVFNDNQLSSILTSLLAIPMSPDLPTHNARKTWTLAIWLLQTQRLPLSITAPANDRILASLWRGISSKLGRGGKPGTMSNGFRTSATVVALLRHIAISLDYYGKEEDMELPTQMLLTVNTTLAGLYPTQPTAALVFFPALLDAVNNCPQNLLVSLLVTLRKGLCAWLEDSREALGDEAYSGVVAPLYEAILFRMSSTPATLNNLANTGRLIAAPFLRIPPPAIVGLSFETFWRATYHKLHWMQDKFPEAIKTCLKTFDEVYGGDLTKPPVSDSDVDGQVKRRSTEEERQADLDEIFGDSELNADESSNPSTSKQGPVSASAVSVTYDDMLPSPLEPIPEETSETTKEIDENSALSSGTTTSELIASSPAAALEDDPFLVSHAQTNAPPNLFSPAEGTSTAGSHEKTDARPEDAVETISSSSVSAVPREPETEEEREVDDALWSNNSSSPLKSSKKVKAAATAPSDEKAPDETSLQTKPGAQALTLEESDVVVVERSSLELLFAPEEEEVDQLQEDTEDTSTTYFSVSESISSAPMMSTVPPKSQKGSFQAIKTSFFFASVQASAREDPKTPTKNRVLKAPRMERDRKSASTLGPECYTSLREEEEEEAQAQEEEEEEEEEDKEEEEGQNVRSSKQKSVISNIEPRLTRSVSLNNLSAASRTRSKSKTLKRGIIEEVLTPRVTKRRRLNSEDVTPKPSLARTRSAPTPTTLSASVRRSTRKRMPPVPLDEPLRLRSGKVATPVGTPARRARRKSSVSDEDTDNEGEEEQEEAAAIADSSPSKGKKRAVDNVEADPEVESQPGSPRKRRSFMDSVEVASASCASTKIKKESIDVDVIASSDPVTPKTTRFQESVRPVSRRGALSMQLGSSPSAPRFKRESSELSSIQCLQEAYDRLASASDEMHMDDLLKARKLAMDMYTLLNMAIDRKVADTYTSPKKPQADEASSSTPTTNARMLRSRVRS